MNETEYVDLHVNEMKISGRSYTIYWQSKDITIYPMQPVQLWFYFSNYDRREESDKLTILIYLVLKEFPSESNSCVKDKAA